MSKPQYYLSQCSEAASKSPMYFTLGAVLVKGGKIISTGYNHHRPHYDGGEVTKHGHRKPVSMHAEMHAIVNVTGMTPSFKTQGCNKSKGKRDQIASRDTIATTSKATKHRRGVLNVPTTSESRSIASGDSEGVLDRRQEGSSERCSGVSVPKPRCATDKGWDVRRRDSRVNGADLYVARFTKNGMGSAKPCWRCLEWSRWAGIKRIFHWNPDLGRFEAVKVNDAQREHYETHSDIRLFSGMVCPFRPLGNAQC
ncbi:hypothetical protein K474DRAFT_1596903 [Panus rudis PR-1116 ss-1]|nr:hypothetical protein K474DRAFT_1596903 [Panus rudis PR-1116 ss-1]